jgi:anionic cell wall polymer biosynthesis LytR-Cps2A-Psr (LCP) family protein
MRRPAAHERTGRSGKPARAQNIDSGGDNNRVNRQKKMLIALFESMQEQNLILKIPDIVSSFKGQLFTNCTFGQTAALTKFAYTLDGENIGKYRWAPTAGAAETRISSTGTSA